MRCGLTVVPKVLQALNSWKTFFPQVEPSPSTVLGSMSQLQQQFGGWGGDVTHDWRVVAVRLGLGLCYSCIALGARNAAGVIWRQQVFE